jgi:hypothetical protein
MGLPYFVRYLAIISIIYQREKVQYFCIKNVITLVRVEKGQKVDWAQIIFNNLCSELDWWYKYVKESKGDKKNTYQSTLVLGKNLSISICVSKGEPHKPLAKVKTTREEMKTTLENKKKVASNSPRSAFKRKNRVEEGGAPSSRVRRE